MKKQFSTSVVFSLCGLSALSLLSAHAKESESCQFFSMPKVETLPANTYIEPSGRYRMTNLPNPSASASPTPRGSAPPVTSVDLLTKKSIYLPTSFGDGSYLGTTNPGYFFRVDPKAAVIEIHDFHKKAFIKTPIPEQLRPAITANQDMRHHPIWNTISSSTISEDGRTLFLSTADGTYVQKIGSSKATLLPKVSVATYGSNLQSVTPDGRFLLTSNFDGNSKIYDLKNPESPKIETLEPRPGGALNLSGNELAWVATDGKVYVRNLATGKQTHYDPPSSPSPQTPQPSPSSQAWGAGMGGGGLYGGVYGGLTPIGEAPPKVLLFENGTKLAIGNTKGKVEIVDVKSGSRREIATSPFENLKITPDGNRLILSGNGHVQSLDVKSGQIRSLELPKSSSEQVFNFYGITPLPDGRVAYNDFSFDGGGKSTGAVRIYTFDGVCVSNSIRVVEKDCCTTGRGTEPTDQSQWMKDIIAKDLCQHDYDQKAWKRFAPTPKTESIKQEDAERLLVRFQKVGGFDFNSDLPALVAILRSNMPESQPDLTLGALQTVYHQSPELLNTLYSQFPKLRSLRYSGMAQSCRSEAESKAFEKDALRFFDSMMKTHGNQAVLSDWESLRIFTPAYAKMSAAKKDELLDHIADSLSNRAVATDFQDVFQSKLYKFSYQAAAPLVGEETKPLTDLTLTRNRDGSIRPVIMASHPVDNDTGTVTPYGFAVKNLSQHDADEVPVNQSRRVSADWSVNSRRFHADIDLTRAGLGDLVEKAPAPKYDELWKDGKLTGIVVTGSNLHGDEAMVLDEYLEYYREKGFKFAQPKQKVDNLSTFLKKKISSGEGDYLIKEAHADGDEKNVFRVYKQAEILEGHKPLPNGKEEVVYLVFPSSSGDQQTALVSNHDFGDWVRERDKNQQGQFVYFNTSCWGATQASNQLAATRSKKLLTIASTTTVETFTNEKNAAEQILLTSFREGKNYEQMRNALEADDGYHRKSDNQFIFPDEKAYDREVTSRLSDTLDSKVSITDQDGHPYNIDVVH